MTIKISITERDIAGAQKDTIANLIGALQALSASAKVKSEITAGTEIEVPNVPHGAKSSGTVIVPEKVYKDEPIPAKPTPTAKAEPEPAPTSEPEPEPETKGEEKDAAEAEAPLLEEAAKDGAAAPDTNAAKTDDKKLRETVKAECAAIARNGKSKALKGLLADYSVEKLSEIPDDALEDFLKKARAL